MIRYNALRVPRFTPEFYEAERLCAAQDAAALIRFILRVENRAAGQRFSIRFA